MNENDYKSEYTENNTTENAATENITESTSAPQADSDVTELETPYQVSVRHPEWQDRRDNGSSQQQQQQQNDTWRRPRQEDSSNNGGFRAEEIKFEEVSSEDIPPKKAPKKKKRSRVVTVLCGAAAACLIFAGGAVIGSSFINGDAAKSPVITATNTPTIEIVNKTDTAENEGGLSGEAIYQKVNPSIVSVLVSSINGTGSGSGVIMTEDGYIITNNHVVEDAPQVSVQLNDGTQLQAKIIGCDEKTDLAVLKVEPDGKLTAAEFGNSDLLQPGERAYAIGSPGGVELANTITGGFISAINRDITIDDRVMTLIQTDASINPGNSGGALINKYGQVVGITSAKMSSQGFGTASYEGLGFAIPMSTAKGIVDELIANGYITGRPSIGITGQNISAQRAQASNLPQGVYIRSIDERARAASEGLLAGDIITKVDGQEIKTMNEINKIKEAKKAGDKLTLTVYRMSTGKMLDVAITLTDEHDLADDNSNQQYSQSYPQQGDSGYSQYDEDPFSYFFNW